MEDYDPRDPDDIPKGPMLPSRHDLTQACRVSRIFATATRILYRKVHINISSIVDPRLTQLFTGPNVGLKYVKEVHVKTNSRNALIAAYQWLEILSNLIPVDQLESFTWDPPTALSSRMLKNLWQRQRKLKRMEIFSTWNYNHSGMNAEEDVDLLMSLRLHIVPESGDTAYLGCAALERGNVSSLEVDGRLWQEPARDNNDEDDDEDENNQKAQEYLVDCLFDHLPRIAPALMPLNSQFTSLTLKDLAMSDCKHTWCTSVQFRNLKHLVLEHCKGVDVFLLKIAPGAGTPALRSPTIVHALEDREDRTVHAIDELLRLPKNSLRELVLCLRNAPSLPKPASLLAHKVTLTKLSIDIASNHVGLDKTLNHLVYGVDDLREIARAVSSIKELGIALPAHELAYSDFTCESGLPASMDIILTHLKLTTLNIFSWPRHYKPHMPAGYYTSTAPQLARVAADIITRHRRFDKGNGNFASFDMYTALEVVAFGVRDRNFHVPKPVYFVPNEVSVMGMKKMLHAHAVSMRYLRRQRLQGRVLDYEKRDFDANARYNMNYDDRDDMAEQETDW